MYFGAHTCGKGIYWKQRSIKQDKIPESVKSLTPGVMIQNSS